MSRAILLEVRISLNYADTVTESAGERMRRENQGKLLVITCECGFQIPVVSDAEAVGNVIDVHVAEHRSKKTDPAEAEKEAERIQDYLFSELFRKIGKITF